MPKANVNCSCLLKLNLNIHVVAVHHRPDIYRLTLVIQLCTGKLLSDLWTQCKAQKPCTNLQNALQRLRKMLHRWNEKTVCNQGMWNTKKLLIQSPGTLLKSFARAQDGIKNAFLRLAKSMCMEKGRILNSFWPWGGGGGGGGGKCPRQFQLSKTSLIFKQYLPNVAIFTKIYWRTRFWKKSASRV